MIEPGKLYKCSHHLLVGLLKEISPTKIYIVYPDDIFYVIEKVEENGNTFLFCLFPNFSGWFAYFEDLKIEEVQND